MLCRNLETNARHPCDGERVPLVSAGTTRLTQQLPRQTRRRVRNTKPTHTATFTREQVRAGWAPSPHSPARPHHPPASGFVLLQTEPLGTSHRSDGHYEEPPLRRPRFPPPAPLGTAGASPHSPSKSVRTTTQRNRPPSVRPRGRRSRPRHLPRRPERHPDAPGLPRSGHTQESVSVRISAWNSKATFPSPPYSLSLQINS